ncbi:MAG: asparagine synthase (glutamine-hydrolyzing) [Gemmatimonadaceae bacterium]
MCGICGIVRLTGLTPEDSASVRAMTAMLRHRGPDGVGLWNDARAAFGHARLAIIDLEGGYQPMMNETGDIAVIFNGEIYNFADLRSELQRAGHVLQTRSDTEVIVHGYESWGDDVVLKLRGMFAFALWDARKGRMLFARDRFGEKPLYYYDATARGGAFYFASEMKALVSRPNVPRRLNERRLGEFMMFRCVAGPETLFDEIKELEPGCRMVLTPDRCRIERYWSPQPTVTANNAPVEQLVRDGAALLRDAVDCRLVSDVALGTITSGGLDSSLVTMIATECAGASLDTYCVGFADPAFDERPAARRIARRARSRHHELEFTAQQLVGELDRLTWAHDEPLTHSNSIPMHLLFRLAKEGAGVTVLLSGEGADELFGGYGWYAALQRRGPLNHVPGLRGLASLLPGARFRTLERVLHPDYPLVSNAVSRRDDVAPLFAGLMDALETRRPLWPANGHLTPTDGLFIYDQRTYLPPLLQRQDRMAMAAGVEARVVFLDHALAEWANRIPSSAKLEGGKRKALLRRIARGWLDSEVLERQKVGFTLPIGEWMRDGGVLHDRVAALRDPQTFVRCVLLGAAIDRAVDEHWRRRRDNTDLLWTLLSLDAWGSLFLGGGLAVTELPGARTGKQLPAPRPLSRVDSA